MSGLELLVILVLAGIIVIIIYQYIKNNPEKINIPDEWSNKMNVTDKIKNINMPNTDSFSDKIDKFLDSKSDKLIEEWELATKNDINELEKKYDYISLNIDELSTRFNEFREYTNEKIDGLSNRIDKLE